MQLLEPEQNQEGATLRKISDISEVNARIRAFILKKFPAARKRNLDDVVPLLESGIIDSLGVLDLVGFLEEAFDVKIDDDDLIPENFGNIECIVAFVQKKNSQSKVAAT
jgi:acyl carrier protein